MASFNYEFNFTDDYSEYVYGQYDEADVPLKELVVDTITRIKKVMSLNPGIKNMSSQLEYNGQLFKVRLAQSH